MNVEEVKLILYRCTWCYSRAKRVEETIQRLRSSAERVTPVYSLAPGGSRDTSRVEADTIRIIEMEANYEEELKKYRELIRKTQSIIDLVPHDIQRTVLREHFVYGQTLEDVSIGIAYSTRQTYRFYDDGLQWLADHASLWH